MSYFDRSKLSETPNNIMFSNPKVPDPVKSFQNCDSCKTHRAKIPNTTCQNCYIKRLVCIREGCNNHVDNKDSYCKICFKGSLYNPKCEKEECEIRVSPDCRYCYEHMQ